MAAYMQCVALPSIVNANQYSLQCKPTAYNKKQNTFLTCCSALDDCMYGMGCFTVTHVNRLQKTAKV